MEVLHGVESQNLLTAGPHGFPKPETLNPEP